MNKKVEWWGVLVLFLAVMTIVSLKGITARRWQGKNWQAVPQSES